MQLYLRALDLFASSPALDIEDAVIVAHVQHLGVSELLSYDRALDTVQGITRQEP